MDAQFFLVLIASFSVLLYFLIRLGETHQHRINYEFLKFAQAEERISWRMRIYYLSEFLFMFLIVAEHFYLGSKFERIHTVIGLSFLMIGVSLRFWAITTLGKLWSKRCMFIQGNYVVKEGPFKYLPHPEYLSRFLDIVGMCVMFKAFYSLGIYVVSISYLLYGIIKVESSQMKRLAIDDNSSGIIHK